MAVTLLSKNGYGQLEINKLEARTTGQMEAQVTFDGVAMKTMTDRSTLDYAENGMILKLDNAKNALIPAPTGAKTGLLLLACVEKVYDDAHNGLKDFKIGLKDDFPPRAFYLNPGDVFTTNLCYINDGSGSDEVAPGSKVCIGANAGILEIAKTSANAFAEVIKVTTMPDGQTAYKIRVL